MLITNSKVFFRGKIIDADIAIDDGKIIDIGRDLVDDYTIDADGLLILPGAIDAHVHFRDLKEKHKEDWYTGSSAAISGGVTTVIDHPNTNPPTTNVDHFEMKLKEAKNKSIVDFGINGGVEEPPQMKNLWELGAMAFGEIFMYDHGEEEIQEALNEIKNLGAIACIHAEDRECIEEDPSRPDICECKAIENVLRMEEEMKIHICHLSTKSGLELMKDSSATVEVTPHHLFLSKDTSTIVNPPLRDESNRRYLWDNLDKIDIIASDHAPHSMNEKEEGAPGIPGVETMMPLMLSSVNKGLISLSRCVSLLSSNPARIFGLRSKGEIKIGKDADFVIVNMKEERKIEAEKMHSKAGWTPFKGMYGIFPKMTFVRGNLVYDGEVVGKEGSGRFLSGMGCMGNRTAW
jgi:dihydroorotase